MRMQIAMEVSLDDIEAIPGKQSLVRSDPAHITIVERMMSVFDNLPPIYIQKAKGRLFLTDGYHRCEAAARLGRKTVRAIVLDITGEPITEYNLAVSQSWTKLQGAPHA